MFEAIRLDHNAVEKEEEAIRRRARDLPDMLRLEYHERLKKELKDPDTYASLNYFFLTGIHHMYLNKYVRGILNLVVLLVGLVMLALFTPLGVLIIGFILVIELMALFRSQVVVKDHNNKICRRILDEIEP